MTKSPMVFAIGLFCAWNVGRMKRSGMRLSRLGFATPTGTFKKFPYVQNVSDGVTQTPSRFVIRPASGKIFAES
jgi:hypothetical protein